MAQDAYTKYMARVKHRFLHRCASIADVRCLVNAAKERWLRARMREAQNDDQWARRAH